MCGVPMDATFHGGSNDTIGGRVRFRRPEISPICPDFQKDQASVVDTVIISETFADKTVLPILECLHLKIKNKQKFYLQM